MPEKSDGLDGKFRVDVAWNLISLVFLAIAGLSLNLVIGHYYGAQYLGLFNIAFALYIFLSQFAVFGLHMSILRYVSEHREQDQEKMDAAISHGFILVIIVSFLVTLLSWGLLPAITFVYKSPEMPTAYLVILPGLFVFSLNKYLLAVVNGARHMRAFAIFQSLRFIFIFLALMGIIMTGQRGEYLTFIITISEFLLFPLLFVYTFFKSNIVKSFHFNKKSSWIFDHIHFGRRVFLSGTVTELNTRVDILMIGAFLGEVETGIYSIAILLVEGLTQAAVVIRNNVNPLLTRYVLEKRFEDFSYFSRKVSLYFFLFMIFSGTILVLIYPFMAQIIFPKGAFDAAYTPLIILTIGVVLASPYLPFNMILSQADKPSIHSFYMVSILLSNVIFNLIAIPFWGILGAAFATALSYLVSVVLLIYFSKRFLGVKIWL